MCFSSNWVESAETFSNLWNYTYFILSEPIPRIPKSRIKRSILSLWFLSCTVLLAAHSSVLRNIFIRSNPYIVIDSWEDLFERKDLKILVFESSFLKIYAENIDTEMARNFKARMDSIDYIHKTLDQDNVDKIINGTAVASLPKQFAEDCSYFQMKTNKELCKELYLSRYGGYNSFNFIPVSKNMDKNILRHLINT